MARSPTRSRIVDALVERKLVSRETAPGDRRSVRIEATEDGIALLNAGRERRVRDLGTALGAGSRSIGPLDVDRHLVAGEIDAD